MRASTIAAGAALATGAAAQFPPVSFGFPTAPVQLGVSFPKFNVTMGDHVGINWPDPSPKEAPTITYTQGNQEDTYIVLMVDPDDPTPENPDDRFIIHWLQPNSQLDINGVLRNYTPPAVPFVRPHTPTFADPHRYIQYLFNQPRGFEVPDDFKIFNADRREEFDFYKFIQEGGLDAPLAANFFYSENRTEVPVDFFAGPSGSFPNGVSASYVPGTWKATGTGAYIPPTATGGSTPVYTGAASSSSVSHFGLAVAAAMAVIGF